MSPTPETPTDAPDDAPSPAPLGLPRPVALWAIFAVSLAGLLLEVAYTRVISYKLWYYYTYLVIGLALLGLGTGATAVVLSKRLRSADTRSVLTSFGLLGAVGLVAGYLVVAVMPIDTVALWDYGTRASVVNFGSLAVICLALFLSFMPIGVIVSTLLSRGRSEVNRLYFADLIGAGLGCLVVVAMISRMGPPRVIMIASLVLAGTALALQWSAPGILRTGGAVLTVALVLVAVLGESVLPTIRNEASKISADGTGLSGWGPVFRVDVNEHPTVPGGKALIHDGTWGSAIYPFDGDPATLTRFDDDPRSWPFAVLGEPPGRELIIGSAGGNEILASLYHDSDDIEAVELNPVTVDALTGKYAEMSGNLADRDEVTLTQGDGRSYLARSDGDFDLVWFVAPDSYAANNAASAGAFVLSESYLYTTDMITETLEHLSDDGISVAQFGEIDFDAQPNRTARYVLTAREALTQFGIEAPERHIMVAKSEDPFTSGLSTIIVSRSPLDAAAVQRFVESVESTTNSEVIYAPGMAIGEGPVARMAGATDPAELERLVQEYPADVSPISDDAPFFWHFTPFDEVIRAIGEATRVDVREYAIGERVLLLLLATATLFAVVFLLAPFLVIRKQWRRLPAKGISAVYFAALGLGFMLYEITMIQMLVGYLGFPSYSLTVTLASILVFTGLGALLSNRFSTAPTRALPILFGALVVLTLFYRLGLPPLMDSTLTAGLPLRIAFAFVVLAPLGLCLGMFMPFGLRLVGVLSPHSDEYVAWGWAINGVFSVIGSVLTTILAMSWGFRTVHIIALGVYATAVVALWRLDARRRSMGIDIPDHESPAVDVTEAATTADQQPAPV